MSGKDQLFVGEEGTRVAAVRSYRDLIVWQKSMEIVAFVYQATAGLPETEQFGLVAQMRRAAVSVPSDIAEGYGRQATGEYRHHLSIARGSILELETQTLICERLGYLDRGATAPILDELAQISRMGATSVSRLR